MVSSQEEDVRLLQVVAETISNLFLYQVAAKQVHYAQPRGTGNSN